MSKVYRVPEFETLEYLKWFYGGGWFDYQDHHATKVIDNNVYETTSGEVLLEKGQSWKEHGAKSAISHLYFPVNPDTKATKFSYTNKYSKIVHSSFLGKRTLCDFVISDRDWFLENDSYEGTPNCPRCQKEIELQLKLHKKKAERFKKEYLGEALSKAEELIQLFSC